MRTGEEHGQDRSTGMHGPTGRHQSSVNLLIAVRDFTLLDRIEVLLTRHDALNIDWIHWSVDDDNAAWARWSGQTRSELHCSKLRTMHLPWVAQMSV
jgi:hypothetical protein